MSENGLRLLSEHLAKVKQQSEVAVQALGEKAKVLESENDLLRRQLQACLDELDFRNGQVEQLKMENTKKWRVEERNDWRALVDSVQLDRDEVMPLVSIGRRLCSCSLTPSHHHPSAAAGSKRRTGIDDQRAPGRVGFF